MLCDGSKLDAVKNQTVRINPIIRLQMHSNSKKKKKFFYMVIGFYKKVDYPHGALDHLTDVVLLWWFTLSVDTKKKEWGKTISWKGYMLLLFLSGVWFDNEIRRPQRVLRDFEPLLCMWWGKQTQQPEETFDTVPFLNHLFSSDLWRFLNFNYNIKYLMPN